jgi:ABC-type branched-subunit amino acid transport system substrate-binding protein
MPSSRPNSCGKPKGPALGLLCAALLALAACATPQDRTSGQAVQPAPVEQPPEAPSLAGTTEDGKVGIGFMAPLSGEQAAVGQALLQAAQMAFLDNADGKAALLVADTQGSPAGAARAAQELLDQGAAIIIGPLFAGSVQAAAPVTRRAGVPLLAFSNDDSVAGPGVYTLGLSPAAQIERVVDYAARNGLLRFAAFAPDDRYGRLAVSALQQSAGRPPLEVTQVAFYSQSGEDVDPKARDFSRGLGSYDAVLLPDGGQRLMGVVPYLPYYDVGPPEVRFLGTQRWDSLDVAREEALSGGWFAAPDPQSWADFQSRYASLYQEGAPRVASLGYDATAIASVLARGLGAGADPSEAFRQEALTQNGGFFGIDGIFRLLPDGKVERGLAIMEMQRGGPVVIEAAPQSFDAFF